MLSWQAPRSYDWVKTTLPDTCLWPLPRYMHALCSSTPWWFENVNLSSCDKKRKRIFTNLSYRARALTFLFKKKQKSFFYYFLWYRWIFSNQYISQSKIIFRMILWLHVLYRFSRINKKIHFLNNGYKFYKFLQ
jgi:hypothetical protein